MKKLKPCLWFNNEVEEAANFYVEVFRGKLLSIDRMPEGGPGPAGSVLTAQIEILGETFMLLNGGPQFNFTEAVSFMVDCRDQSETDYYWDSLLAGGGEESMCGWLKDKYGLSWQIVPKKLGELLGSNNRAGASRAMQAMLQMRKIVIADLETAFGE